MTGKLSKDRLWCLSAFANGGWTIGRGDWIGVKKWDAHKASLVKDGYLEPDEYGSDNFRITPSGRAALGEKE
jgi:hypothetical protein